MMSDAEQIVTRVGDLANSHDAEAIQEYLGDDMDFYNPITGWSGKQGMYEIHTTLFKAFPDLYYEFSRVISSGDTVVAECMLKGTHENDLMGIAPTQRQLELPAAFIIDVGSDTVKKWVSYFDVTSMMRQLGVQE